MSEGFASPNRDMRTTRIALGVVGLAILAALAWLALQGPASEVASRTPAPLRSAPVESVALQLPAPEIQPVSVDVERSVVAIEPASQQAVLAVQARSKKDGVPLAGVRISVWPSPSEAGSTLAAVDSASADFGASPLTDSAGRAEIRVPPGQALALTALAEHDLTSAVNQRVEPLAPGETRTIELLLPAESDLHFIGRVLADESGAPLAEAWVSAGDFRDLIRLPDSATQPARINRSARGRFHVEADGTFELDARSSEELTVRIDAPGRAWVIVPLLDGHATRALAYEVRLSRSASIEVLAVGPARVPIEGARLRLCADSYRVTEALQSLPALLSLDELIWDARTSTDGRARLEGLPSGVPFRLEAARDEASALRVVAELQPLQPGEVRTLEVSLGAGSAVHGRMQRADGTPIGPAEVWMRPWTGPWSASFNPYAKEEARTTTTAEDGGFAFEDVPDGEWVLAPRPEGRYAADPQRVSVASGRADREVVLTAYDDLFIEGTVVDPSGAPVRAFVFAVAKSHPAFTTASSDSAGRFSLGPFAPGAYGVQARSAGGTESNSPMLEVQAGATDVQLRLQIGGRIRGRVVDAATGEGVEAHVVVAPQRSESQQGFGGTLGSSTSDGSFDFQGLEPGLYSVAASTTSGSFGNATDLLLEDGTQLEDIVVRVQPGARLRLRYDGPQEVAQVRAYSGSVVVALDGIERGTSHMFVVPPGTLQIVWSEHDGTDSIAHDQEVTVALGELVELQLGTEGSPR